MFVNMLKILKFILIHIKEVFGTGWRNLAIFFIVFHWSLIFLFDQILMRGRYIDPMWINLVLLPAYLFFLIVFTPYVFYVLPTFLLKRFFDRLIHY